LSNNPRQRARLRLAPPAAELPDDRAAVARALLDRFVPAGQVLEDQAIPALGWSPAAIGEIEALQNDPRYLIGRFTQAIAELLPRKMPPLDATAQLLTEAIADAMDYRRCQCPKCGEGVCGDCEPSWLKAEQYWSLYGRLGLIGNLPVRPGLKSVPR
jgi:hypothetical protein